MPRGDMRRSSPNFQDGWRISAGCAAMRRDLSPYPERLRRVCAELPETGALLILNARNIRYLTGFTGGDGALMAGPTWLVLLVDGRYVTQAGGEAAGQALFEFFPRVAGVAARAKM